jgi:lysylphosphatidylglycerol synthetase-like protein (DUF2156 family)
MTREDWVNLLIRLFVDLVAIGVLSLMVSRRRPRRGLFMLYSSFNIGLFAVLVVISHKHVGPAIGFGLFAMLSIVRLRSEPFGNADLAYFFCALVLALANGLRLDDEGLAIAMSVLILVGLWLVDHPALYRRTARQRVTLDEVVTGDAAVRAALERRLGVEVVEAVVEETDYVREVTRVSVRYLQPAGRPEPEPAIEAAP